MVDPRSVQAMEEMMVFFGCMGGLTSLTVLGAMWIRRRDRAGVGTSAVVQRLDEVVERLARLENSVDSSALEIERISEGQRFTTKLLAERSEAGPLDRPKAGGIAPR